MLKRGLVEMPTLAVYPSITAFADDTDRTTSSREPALLSIFHIGAYSVCRARASAQAMLSTENVLETQLRADERERICLRAACGVRWLPL